MTRVNNKTKYWRPATSMAFSLTKRTDKHIFGPLNYLAKELGICAMAVGRDAFMRGLELIARDAGKDLNKVVLTELGEVVKQDQPLYQGNPKSQEKKAV